VVVFIYPKDTSKELYQTRDRDGGERVEIVQNKILRQRQNRYGFPGVTLKITNWKQIPFKKIEKIWGRCWFLKDSLFRARRQPDNKPGQPGFWGFVHGGTRLKGKAFIIYFSLGSACSNLLEKVRLVSNREAESTDVKMRVSVSGQCQARNTENAWKTYKQIDAKLLDANMGGRGAY